jgi:hypothetical protein
MVQTPPTTEEEFTPEMAEDYIQSNIFDFEEELLANELANDGALDENIAPDNKSQNKATKDMNELEDIMNDLTDEELEDLL